MPGPRRKDRNPPRGPTVRRRDRDDRAPQTLPPDAEALSRGDPYPRRPLRPRLGDTRTVASIPGVANRDARAVLEAKVMALKEAMASGEDARVAAELAAIVQLRLWRGRSFTALAAFAEDLLGLPPGRAEELAAAGRTALGLMEDPTDEAIAVAVRVEAALLVVEVPGRALLRGERGKETLTVEIAADRAPTGLQEVAAALRPLVRELDRSRR